MFLPYGDDVQRQRVPVCVLVIIALNVIVAAWEVRLAQNFKTKPDEIIGFFELFGLVPKDAQSGSVMGVFTYMFLHGGLVHLLGNMLVLWAFGPTLEELLGRARFAIIYVATSISAGLTHVLFNLHSEAPLIGASGAIAGLIGVYGIAVGPDTKIRTLMFFFGVRKVSIPTVVYALFWLLSQWLGFMGSTSPGSEDNVAYACHVGGFFGGMLLYPLIKVHGRRLIDRGFGEKCIEDADAVEQRRIQRAETPVPDRPPEVFSCTYCATALEPSHEIAPSLFRCPKPGCGHMNMSPSALPQIPLSRHRTPVHSR